MSIAQLKTRKSALKISKWRRTRRTNFLGARATKCPSATWSPIWLCIISYPDPTVLLTEMWSCPWNDDPSPPPSFTFYDLLSMVVVCNYHYWKYMQVIRSIHTTAKFERSRTASLFYYWTTTGLFKWNFSFEYTKWIFHENSEIEEMYYLWTFLK